MTRGGMAWSGILIQLLLLVAWHGMAWHDVCRLFVSDRVEIPKSSQLHSNTWQSSGIDCSASLHQKSDRSSLFGHITW